ncbi:hypothetical protein TNCV_4568811 [Trichonephila clavipes]|nr:hypothetical protein TNCV_4568811 [Trichonephila clavipes]
MDNITVPHLNGMNYFIWELKMNAALSLKRFDSLIINEKPADLSRKEEIEEELKNLDAVCIVCKAITRRSPGVAFRDGRQHESSVG